MSPQVLGSPADARPSRRALICFWEGYLGVAPSLLNAARVLADEGYEVEILCLEQGAQFAGEPELPRSTSVRRIPAWSRGKAWNSWPRPLRAPLRALATLLDYLRFRRTAERLGRTGSLSLIIGVDAYGLAVAAAARRTAPKAAVVYWSLELVDRHKLRNPIDRWVKSREAEFAEIAAAAIVQDEARGQVLLSGLSASPPQLLLVPNTPLGKPGAADRGYLRRRLGLPSGASIVLQAGVVNDEVLARDIARTVPDWPQDWRLVLHERERRPPADPYLQEVKRLGGEKLLLSLEPVPLDQLDDIFASARVGLVTYAPDLGPNYSEIAYASGKLGYFLRNGVPIIVNDLPSLRALVEDAGCGVVVSTLDQFPLALEKIERDYDSFSTAASAYYERRLEFGAHFRNALGRLSRVETGDVIHSGGSRSGK